MLKQDYCLIKKIDADKQIVYGEVYAPNIIDTHGEMMLAVDIEKMAHKFMQLSYIERAIDTQHNQISNGSYPIESFIARKGDPDYTEGAWVLGVKITDSTIWQAVKEGKINGYSMQSMVRKLPAVVDLEITPSELGVTEKADGHTHMFFVRVDDDGKVSEGRTSADAGHSHLIRSGTATELSDGHAHRFFV
jgi:hypothetical protein